MIFLSTYVHFASFLLLPLPLSMCSGEDFIFSDLYGSSALFLTLSYAAVKGSSPASLPAYGLEEMLRTGIICCIRADDG